MELVPDEVEKQLKIVEGVPKSSRPLPSSYTILQLLKSYSGFNAWMSKVAKRGTMSKLQSNLPAADAAVDDALKAKRASALLKIGERHVYDGNYDEAKTVFLDAFALVDGDEGVQSALTDDDFPRILEWTGMVRHWMYDLHSSRQCFKKCAELESTNVSTIICAELVGRIDCNRY